MHDVQRVRFVLHLCAPVKQVCVGIMWRCMRLGVCSSADLTWCDLNQHMHACMCIYMCTYVCVYVNVCVCECVCFCLRLSGYGCEDHFLEEDTIQHAWECLGEILSSDCTVDLLCDVGMPLIHHGVRYNCRAWLLNRQILFIRPKRILAEDGNYREQRWFSPWVRPATVEDHVLPPFIQGITGQHSGLCCAVVHVLLVVYSPLFLWEDPEDTCRQREGERDRNWE